MSAPHNAPHNAEAFAAALEAIPYARFLGVHAAPDSADTGVMAFADHLIGNPLLPALHGGSVAAFMELTAGAALRAHTGRAAKPIDVSVAYLRSGRPVTTFARATVRKAGRRVAYVHVLAWQEDEATPTAELSAHFMLAHNNE